MKKFIFNFKSKNVKKIKFPKNILGGKGANLSEMGRMGLPVPPGFTISTEVCDLFFKSNKKLNCQKIFLEAKVQIFLRWEEWDYLYPLVLQYLQRYVTCFIRIKKN